MANRFSVGSTQKGSRPLQGITLEQTDRKNHRLVGELATAENASMTK